MLVVILTTIGAIALSYGIQYVADQVDQTKANIRKMNASEVISRIQNYVSRIRATSADASNALTEKLGNMPQIAAVGSLNSYLSKEKARLSSKRDKVMKKENVIQSMANSIESEAAAFAYQPNTYKTSKAGEIEMKRITQKAKDLEGVSNELSKQIEQEA